MPQHIFNVIPCRPQAPEMIINGETGQKQRPVVIGIYPGSGGQRPAEPLWQIAERPDVSVFGNKFIVVPKQTVFQSIAVSNKSGQN